MPIDDSRPFQETGLRGFLVTGNRLFLEPYLKAHPLDELGKLRTLVNDNPSQQARVDEVQERDEFVRREGRAHLDANGVSIATNVFDTCTAEVSCTVADPEEMGRHFGEAF